jgi:leucyl-tRNA synthetase
MRRDSIPYDFKSLEPKWQSLWRDRNLFEVHPSGDRPKFYYLDMFPYPSGNLHMGHMRNYVIGDVISRSMHMRGRNVLHPMGWDAFGLPAENAAIKNGTHPAEWTRECIANMKRQFDQIGISFDWTKEVSTCEPEYYRWNQWIFLQMFRRGLAYRGGAPANWCPSCRTVLADEEVVAGGCNRCGTQVERRLMEQWFFAITRYADRLLADISLLDRWPERVRVMQQNWIGRSHGVQFAFEIADLRGEKLEVFTTRIDTVYGITYMVLAPEHPLVERLIEGKPGADEVRRFCREAMAEDIAERTAAEAEKRGVFTGAYALHPLTGDRVPIWVGNYVLMEYGTGAIMAVPAHDQRDFDFARRHDLPIVVVIQPEGDDLAPAAMTVAFEGDGLQVNSGPFSGLPNSEALDQMADYLEQQGIGARTVNYRVRDWLVSRQRYWGTPIPIVFCDACGTVPVPEIDLPVLLPDVPDYTPGGRSPLENVPDFVNTTCPACGGPARREVDTLATFVDSAWYYLRYASPHYDAGPFGPDEVSYWLPVDKYVGGIEHATLHLLYARFITKVLHDLGHVSFSEPFIELFTQGMIYKDGAKMSKSLGNVVTPEEINDRYGADTGRVFILFMGPPDQDAEWSDQGVEGVWRFLGRVWRSVVDHADLYLAGWRDALPPHDQLADAARALRRKTHQTIRAITVGIDTMHLNTAVSALMELVNEVMPFAGALTADDQAGRAVYSEAVENLVLVLSPFAPHICDELWSRLGHDRTTWDAAWPAWDEAVAAEESITIAVQVNGKLRDRLEVPADLSMDEAAERALALPNIQRHLEGKQVRQVIKVPGRLINILLT